MINILPPKEKEYLIAEKRKRLIIILWFLFIFFLLCFILVLFSLKFYLGGQLEYKNIILKRSEVRTKYTEIRGIQENISSFNETLQKLTVFYNQKTYFSEILEKISLIIPKDAYLKSISFGFSQNKKDPPYLQATLTGFISTRESLFDFQKVLEKEDNVKDATLPLTNWVNPINIDFAIIVNFKTEKNK